MEAKATNPMEEMVEATVNTALAVRAVVQVLTAVKRAMKLPCRARSHLSDSRGRVFSVDWLFLWRTMQQASRSTERYETRFHRYFATCRPNLT